MKDKVIHVFLDLKDKTHYVGRLWAHVHKRQTSASFQYELDWLKHPERFALEPALMLTEGTYHTEADHSLFGAMNDSAPDRWGRMLMRRAESHLAKKTKEPLRSLNEVDYLLKVNDSIRQGALRFKETLEGPFLTPPNICSIPPLIKLPKLLSATKKFLQNKENEEDLKLLLAPGSSLGGARPKASILGKEGNLSIAKFPRDDDEFLTVLWESVALNLASNAGIPTPKSRLEIVLNKSVLIIQRFDREGNHRIPFLSAMSMLGAKDGELHSYLEIVDAIKQYGAYPKQDMINLWRRIVFSVLISNTDDHLRNHGFLYESCKGWTLSPIYDVNPTSTLIKPRILTTTINLDDGTASLDLALSVADEFGLSQADAKKIAKEVALSVSNWRGVAKNHKISSSEIERMASAFEHLDLKQALSLK
ncbi:MAG: HipA domain-containing protein [Chlamydiota bacterium]